MTPRPDRAVLALGRRTAGLLGIALLLAGPVLAGCGIVRAASKAEHAVSSNKALVDEFTTRLTAGESGTFEAAYVTTGNAPVRIVYAVRPPKELAFSETQSALSASGITSADIVVNASGEYSCTPPSASGPAPGPDWTCQKLRAASAAERNKILSLYTPAHWAGFLRDFSLAAGFAGDRITSSAITVNGFAMSCVDFVAPGVPGTSRICTTAQGILGYVKVASESTSFEITSYSPSPPASLFELPPGARVTTVQAPAS